MAESFVVNPDNPSIRQIFEEYIEQQKARYTDPPWRSEANYHIQRRYTLKIKF